MPRRFGPEWWMVYAAAFVSEFQRSRHEPGQGRWMSFDEAASHCSSDAEFAATVADVALVGFEKAVEGGCIAMPLDKS